MNHIKMGAKNSNNQTRLHLKSMWRMGIHNDILRKWLRKEPVPRPSLWPTFPLRSVFLGFHQNIAFVRQPSQYLLDQQWKSAGIVCFSHSEGDCGFISDNSRTFSAHKFTINVCGALSRLFFPIRCQTPLCARCIFAFARNQGCKQKSQLPTHEC